jgi:tryptophan halogenase
MAPPLQHRTGSGYVFCDKYCSDEEAIATLLANIEGEPLTKPKVVPFVTGMRKKARNKNCLALGLAQGFVEPLESTAIHLVSKTLAFFVRMFPDKNCNQTLVDEFNRRVRADYEEVRDFLILHYCSTALLSAMTANFGFIVKRWLFQQACNNALIFQGC